LGWAFPQIFTPVHVIFLELVMGPTCSIVYENEPMERNTMKQPPRALGDTFLNLHELGISIVQGLVITLGVLFVYQFIIQHGGSEEKTRAMVFSTLIFANILLSFVNRSFFYSVLESFRNRNPLLIGISALVLMMLLVILYVKPISLFFKVASLNISELGMTICIASVSVLWFEVYKYVKRKRSNYHK
jgi:Ca2+-transporting ATPase